MKWDLYDIINGIKIYKSNYIQLFCYVDSEGLTHIINNDELESRKYKIKIIKAIETSYFY